MAVGMSPAFAAQATGTIGGKATDEAKKPYTDYTVQLRDAGTGQIAATVPLDAQGLFSFGSVAESTEVPRRALQHEAEQSGLHGRAVHPDDVVDEQDGREYRLRQGTGGPLAARGRRRHRGGHRLRDAQRQPVARRWPARQGLASVVRAAVAPSTA